MSAKLIEDYQEAYEELKFILDISFDQITIANGEGVFTKVSKSCETYFGVSEDQLVGVSAFDLEKKGVFDTSVTAEVLRQRKEITLIQKTGAKRTLYVKGIPVFSGNKIIKIINVSKDISEKTALTKQLRETKIELDRVKSELRKRQQQNELEIINNSTSMEKVMNLVNYVANSDVNILLLGETGVGKTYIAKAIHKTSLRSNKPFVNINCGAIPENLLESELFGYEPGSFSGANKKGKRGLFEVAEEGTIFLDEIGDMPLDLQVKLLHVLDNKEILRIGGERPIKVKARIISATNKDLNELVKKGLFREDLYYRLNVVPIEIPPLRDRREDIPPLIKKFINQYEDKYGISKEFSIEAFDTLVNYDYPGNIRQLENIIERLIIATPEKEIKGDQINRIIGTVEGVPHVSMELPLKKAVANFERNILIEAFKKYRTTRKVGEILGIDQSTVVKKANRLGIQRDDFYNQDDE